MNCKIWLGIFPMQFRKRIFWASSFCAVISQPHYHGEVVCLRRISLSTFTDIQRRDPHQTSIFGVEISKTCLYFKEEEKKCTFVNVLAEMKPITIQATSLNYLQCGEEIHVHIYTHNEINDQLEASSDQGKKQNPQTQSGKFWRNNISSKIKLDWTYLKL